MKSGEIIIRKTKVGDEFGVANIINEGLKKGNFNYIGRNEPFSKEKIKKMREQYKSEDVISFVAIDKLTEKIIGNVFFQAGLGRTRHRLAGGWSVNLNYQEKGIGTRLLKEAIKEAKKKGFKRIEAESAVVNLGSVNLAKKCGFKIEGTKKKGLLLDNGKYVDTYILGRIL